jgi:hypothetical protein
MLDILCSCGWHESLDIIMSICVGFCVLLGLGSLWICVFLFLL